MTTALNSGVTQRLMMAGWLFAAAGLSGCGGVDGIELNGKIFDAVGLSGDAFKKTEPRTEARAPLVLPPNASRLPEPGAAPQPVTASIAQDSAAWPRDPEQIKKADAEAKKLAHEKYCKEGNWKQKATKDETAAAEAASGTCGNSLFSVVSDALIGKKE